MENWIRNLQVVQKEISAQRENDKANVLKCKPLGILGEGYLGIVCTMFIILQNKVKKLFR